MKSQRDSHADCAGCPRTGSAVDRRAFLRGAALSVAATLAVAGLSPGTALAESVRTIAARRTAGGVRLSYDLPSSDGVSVDVENEVIIARWQGRVYAFSLRCPHRGTQLEWHADEGRIFCPKHKARFRPDGAHDSGRNTRALDRYDLERQGTSIVVDLDRLYRVDQDPVSWNAAVIAVR